MKYKAIRGMKDILPEEIGIWHDLESILFKIMQMYGYKQIRFPVLEYEALFKRTVGEDTDIVSKEMYTFKDRNDENLAMRPEGTACCVRACLENGLLHNQSQKLWYSGPMYRYERPQKGRYRQFYQWGVEALNLAGPDTDAELIAMCERLWHKLGIREYVTLKINTLGNPSERKTYRKSLVEYFEKHKKFLDEDSLRRLTTNPLRILDSKVEKLQPIILGAPKIIDYLSEETHLHFKQFCEYLDALNINYEIDHTLVRGLDYYTHTVFEWETKKIGAQGTICAGGRYNGLIELLSGKAMPASGFALGLERIIILLLDKSKQKFQSQQELLDIYFIRTGDAAITKAIKLSELLRDSIPELRMQLHSGNDSFKSQFKRADKSGARFALILGEDELKDKVVSIKPLRTKAQQVQVPWDEIINTLQMMLGS